MLLQDMFYMDDVNDADQEEDEQGSPPREEGPCSSSLPRNFSLGKHHHQPNQTKKICMQMQAI